MIDRPLKGSPRLALIVGAVNVAVFAAMVVAGVSPLEPSVADLIAWGALFGPLTIDDQWFRLLTSMFLHVGAIHLVLNMIGLASLGPVVEAGLGSVRFLVVYLLCGLGGASASLLVDPARVSAGASGAIFGLAGLLLVIHLRLPASDRRSDWDIEAKGLGSFVFGNLLFGLVHPNIDNAAHVGGLLIGGLLGFLLASRAARWSLPAGMAAVATGLVLVAGRGPDVTAEERAQLRREVARYQESDRRIADLERAVHERPDSAGARLALANEYTLADRAEDAIRTLEQGLARSPRDARLLIALGSLQLNLRRLTGAVRAFERAFALDSTDAEARYDLAVAVHTLGSSAQETGDRVTAETAFRRVLALHADSALDAMARSSLTALTTDSTSRGRR